ncbi:MAG: hypothetical protein GY719_05975 [bacterium]|nr:hypothetical protein [bacterium]
MKKQISMPLDEKLRIIGQLVTRARIYFDIWWLYEGADTRPKYLEAMNKFPEFFRFDSHAHFVALVMYLSQLTESRHNTLNLCALVREAKDSGLIPASEIASAEADLQAVRRIASGVATLRSNLFAHRSAKISYEEAFQKAAISPDQLRDLTETALDVVNTLRRSSSLEERIFHTDSAEHAEALLKSIDRSEVAYWNVT